MITISDISDYLQHLAPVELAEDWDNVGLLVGDNQRIAARIMTCLTITPESTAEAIDRRVDLIVAHHPLPFRPIRRLTTETIEGRLLWDLITAGISIYSPHTAFDSARHGVNQSLAEGCQLEGICPMIDQEDSELGTGRFGRLPSSMRLSEFMDVVKGFLKLNHLRHVGDLSQSVGRIAVACGAAGELLDAARRHGCDCLILGETNFHTCLAAEANGLSLILTGHFSSERFAVVQLAERMTGDFPDLEIWPSERESDPVHWA